MGGKGGEKMKIIEIFGQNREKTYTKLREGCRGILINDGKILLSYEKRINQYMIPGGGIDEGESLEECCIRELGEEVGVVTNPHTLYLTLVEFYRDELFKSHYFLCSKLGECERSLTDTEMSLGLEPKWVDIDEALKIFGSYENYKDINEMRYGLYYREHLALCEMKKLTKPEE